MHARLTLAPRPYQLSLSERLSVVGWRSAALSVLLATAVLSACNGGGSDPTPLGPVSEELRLGVAASGGAAGDALAASLWLSTGSGVLRPGRVPFTMADGQLAQEARFRAEAHLEAHAFAVGGARLEGSALVRRLAAQPNAPADRNGNGSNLDETLADFTGQLAALAGAPMPTAFPQLFGWAERAADYRAPLGNAGRTDYPALGTQLPGQKTVDMEQVGQAMLARILVASSLLQQSRGSRPGADPDAGIDGLLLMLQAVAAEETLLRSLFHNGELLGRLKDPSNYDPRFSEPVWLPTTFQLSEEAAIPGAPASYLPFDQAASLSGQSAVLLASSELAWLASNANPNPTLRDILRGNPFGATPGTRGGSSPPTPSNAGPNWEDDIRPLLHTTYFCVSCHSTAGPLAGLSVSNYQKLLAGGDHREEWPTVVKGDHQSSLLWLVLGGEVKGVATQMPQGGPFMSVEDRELIAQWIDAGAPELPERVDFVVGVDLARAMARNIEGLHLDPTTGALHDRHDGDAPSGFETPRATGDALVALAAYVTAVPTDPTPAIVLEQAAVHAMDELTDASGHVVATREIATGMTSGSADLHGHARLCHGLLAAGRIASRADLLDRGRLLAQVLLAEFFDDDKDLFRTQLGSPTTRYTPGVLAAVLDALRAIDADGTVAGAVAVHDAFLTAVRPVMAFSEWDGFGEVLGDGIADTDENGIPEPTLAGGPHGRAPLFAGEILEGPVASPTGNEPITWSGHIQPLFRNACAACHLDGLRRGNYRVDTPALAGQPGDSGGVFPLIVPGDPEASFLFRKLVQRTPAIGTQMPLGPPLNSRGIELVRRWILEGATSR